jgi:precorrin-6A/cobalt-precorrin-6A reductase
LATYLRPEGITAVIDATHPFAAVMRWNAAAACDAAGVPRVRVERPAWEPTDGDHWISVPDLDVAADAIRANGYRRVFLTTGRKELEPFAGVEEVRFLVRSIEWPDPMPLPEACVILDRGPFAARDEEALLIEHSIDAIVSKNSGGTATAAKLEAARTLGIPVVMIERPPNPPGPLVDTVEAARHWLYEILGERPRNQG